MGEFLRKIDVEKVIAFSEDLVEVLKDRKDSNTLAQQLEQSKAFLSQCDADYTDVHNLLQDYQKKVDVIKKKADDAKSEVPADAEMDLLQKKLEEELQAECLLREELRVITNEISDLEHQRESIEQRRKMLKKLEQDELRAQVLKAKILLSEQHKTKSKIFLRMKLSMYASVTNIIPNLDDPSKISGHIVDRDTKGVEKFEFDPLNATAFDTCNNIWKMISHDKL